MRRYDPTSPLFSLHIPKCGGNSVMLLLRELFGDQLHLHYHDDRTAEPPARTTPAPGSCVHGHFDDRREQGVFDYYPSAEQFITILRDPFAMQVSCYFYMKRLAARNALFLDGRPAGVEPSLVEYLERRIDDPALGPNVLDHLPTALGGDDWESAIDGSFIYVGITEDLRTSAVVLADRLGHPPRWLGHANASPRDEAVPARLREPYRSAHPREFALYEYAARTYDDPAAFRRPIQKSRIEHDELEYRCQLCVDYVACAATGRPRECDGGSRFRPSSRPADGALGGWLAAVARLNGTSRAADLAERLGRRNDLWLGPSLTWRPEPAVFHLAFGRPGGCVDSDLLTEILGPTALEERLQDCARHKVSPLFCSVALVAGSTPQVRLQAPLDPRESYDRLFEALGVLDPVRQLPHHSPYLLEIESEGVLLHFRTRSPPSVPVLDRLGATEGASVVYALTPGDSHLVAAEISLVRSRVDWTDLAGALCDIGLDVGPYNQLKALFHLTEGALSVGLGGGHSINLHYRVMRSLNPTL